MVGSNMTVTVNGKTAGRGQPGHAMIVLPDGVRAPDWLITDCSSSWRDGTGATTFTIDPRHLEG